MGQLVTLLLLVGYVVAYFKWIAAAVVAYLAYRWGRVAWIRRCAAAEPGSVNRGPSRSGLTNNTNGSRPATHAAHGDRR